MLSQDMMLDFYLYVIDAQIARLYTWKHHLLVKSKRLKSSKINNRKPQQFRKFSKKPCKRNQFYHRNRRPNVPKNKRNKFFVPNHVKLNKQFVNQNMKPMNQNRKFCRSFNKSFPKVPVSQNVSSQINQDLNNANRTRKHKIDWSIIIPSMETEKCRHTVFQTVPSQYKEPVAFDSESFIIGIDNHSSCSITNNVNDFVGHLTPTNIRIRGFQGATARASGTGTVKWKIEDDSGCVHEIHIKNTLFVSESKQRLLCPQQWAQQAQDNQPNKRGTFAIQDEDCIELHWDQDRFCKTIPWDRSTNTALMRSATSFKRFKVFNAVLDFKNKVKCHCCESTTFQPDSDEYREEQLPFETIEDINTDSVSVDQSGPNPIADDPQAELLRWHYRLGHLSFNKLKVLCMLGILPRKLANVQPPKCASCIYGAMTRKPWRTKSKPANIKVRPVTDPGDCISVDQLESSTPGFIAQLKGALTKDRYRCATVFVDHASRHGYVYLQRSTSSNETLHAKHAFEAYSSKHNVHIKHYHCDNGRFADNLFVRDVDEKNQTISYAGVNAHFQNGIAEKRIRDLQESARKMLLHAKSRWSEAVSINLWPYALRNANDKICMIPDSLDGTSKYERFVNADISMKIKTHHTIFCPVFALNNSLQAGNKISKWLPRARLGINLGISPRHSRTVSLVLNLRTGLVSPQFHIIHDDFFETVKPGSGNGITKSYWQRLSGFEMDEHMRKADNIKKQPANLIQRTSDGLTPQSEMNSRSHDIQHIQRTNSENNIDFGHANEVNFDQIDPDPEPQELGAINETTNQANLPRKSSRNRQPTWKVQDNMERGLQSYSASYYDALHEDDYLLQDQMSDPISFLAKTDADTMYYHQAMKEPDALEFKRAVVKEILDHCNRKHWIVVKRNEVPDQCDILPAVWSMKRKRDLVTRIPYKYKARLNIHGGKQEFGVNYYDTFSPVITWVTLRLLLIFTLIFGWTARQIDYVLAFPQAPIQFDMYMEIPVGITIDPAIGSNKTHVLKLLKNLYGQKQASRQFYLFTCEKLQEIGFQKSKIDECVFFKEDMIYVLYVDDGILFMRDPTKFKRIFALLASKFDIEDKGEVQQFLGMIFSKKNDHEFHITQTHLIDQIVKDTGLAGTQFKCPQSPSPSTVILQRNQNEKSFDNKRFHYRSVIGKLNYLEKSSRPDIAYAAHQCSRFSQDPKESHAQAVIHLVKYLYGTREKGIIMKPQQNKELVCHVDADFCGNWHKLTAPDDASTAKSRTGFLITYAGCPVSWASKLQTQVALSTTEAEYVALSTSLRDAIPIMNLIKELNERKFITTNSETRIYCKVFEDNTGALEMARVPKMRPRTKHLNVIYHWFTSYVKSGLVKIFPIESIHQKADGYTKPLSHKVFLKHRKSTLHW